MEPAISGMKLRSVPLPRPPAAHAAAIDGTRDEPNTLGMVFEERARLSLSSIFLIGSDATGSVSLTYGQFRTMALHTAERLVSTYCGASGSDLRPIAILADNGLEYVITLIAAWYAALPVVLVPITLPAEVSQVLIRAGGARALIYGASCHQTATALHTLCRDVLASLDDISTLTLRQPETPLSAAQETGLCTRMRTLSKPTDVCAVLSTSGSTTGTSVKAVPLTHANMLASCRSRDAHWAPERLGPADGVLGWLPLAHVMGLLLDLLNTAILHGGRYILYHPQGRPLPASLLHAIVEHAPTFVSAVPWLLDAWRLQSAASPELLAPLRTLRALQVGGALLDEEIAEYFLTRHVPLIQSAGMTETAASLFTGVLLPATATRDHATLKRAYPLRPHATLEYELIVSEEEAEGEAATPAGVVRGELVVVDRGTLTAGYLAAPEANARSFYVGTGGVRRFRTGDTLLARRDIDYTSVFYAGRVDDTISMATGEKVDAAAYEANLRSALRNLLPADSTVPLFTLLGNRLPFPFLAVARGGVPEDALWQAVARVNAALPASCRVSRDAVLSAEAEDLPIGRKRQVIRTLAHSRLLPRMQAVAARLSAPSTVAAPLPPTSSALSISGLFTELANVLGVSVASLAGQEHTNFSALGLTSLLAERLASRLRFAPHLLFMHPTPLRLLAALSRAATNLSPTEPVPSQHNSTHPGTEGIAVIGLACRVAGGVNSPAEFWKALVAGSDLISMPLSDRFPDAATVLNRDEGMPTKGGLLRPKEWLGFDRRFFGVGEVEAGYMDPRQRLALELAWEALESAGIAPSALASSNAAVYAAFSADHAGFEEWLHQRSPLPQDVSAYQSVGGAGAAVAGRVSHALGLRGPSLIVDAACASSAIALSLARTHLLASPPGAVAIVLATQLMLTPTAQLSLTRAGALSPTAHSAPFDASANGYVRSDGCAAVVLRRASSAREAGQRVWCELLGAALTHGGDTAASLTAPSPVAQENAMRSALAQAGVSTDRVSYVESHGTGTRLGDPIEADVLARVYARANVATNSTPPVIVGALKGAMGHTEAASGLLSLVKLSLCAHHSAIPRNVRFSTLTPLVAPAGAVQLAFPTKEQTPWQAAQDGTRYAALSNFGFTGTHGHLVFACPPPPVDSTPPYPAAFPLVLPIAARSEQSLRLQADRWLAYVGALPSWHARASACFTAALHRDHFDAPPPHGAASVWRGGVVMSAEALADAKQLTALAAALVPASVEPSVLSARPRVAFALAGQGLAMPKGGLRALCTRLSAFSAAFAATLARCDQAYSEYVATQPSTPLPPALLPIDEAEDESGAEANAARRPSQAALVSFEISLAALWRSWGIEPSVLIGHSLGEIAAAAISGVLSAEEAVRLVATREAAFVSAANAEGTMAAILADRSTAEALVAQVAAHFAASGSAWAIGLTGYNGPTHHVAAGTREAINFLITLPAQVKRVALPVSRPFHSPLLAPAARAWASAHRLSASPVAASDSTQPPSVISTATGGPIEGAALRTMAHWERHAVSPVLFEAGLLRAAKEAQLVLSIAPSAAFASMTRRALAPSAPAVRALDSLDGPADSVGASPAAALLGAAVRLFSSGVRVRWAAVFADLARGAGVPHGGRFTADPWLPAYAWHREPVKLPGRDPAPPAAHTAGAVAAAAAVARASHRWSPTRLASLSDHMVRGEAILPAAAQLLALLRHAARVASVQLVAPAPLGASEAAAVAAADGDAHLSIEDSAQGDWRLSWNRKGQPCVECAAARGLGPAADEALHTATADAAAALAQAEASCTEEASVATFYTHLRHAQQLGYGPAFRAVTALRLSPDRRWVMSTVAGRDAESADLALPIAQLDACFHTGAALLPLAAPPHLPARLAEAILHHAASAKRAPNSPLLCVHEMLNDAEDAAHGTRSARLYVYDAASRQPVLSIARYTVAPVSHASERRMLHRVVWSPVELPKMAVVRHALVLLSDGGDLCGRLKGQAALRGQWLTELLPGKDAKSAVTERLRAVPAGIARIKVVYGWSLHVASEREPLVGACTSLLHVAQAVAEHSGPPVDVCVLTRGASPASAAQATAERALADSVGAAAQAVAGVAALELNSDQLRVCALDLPLGDAPNQDDAVATVLAALPSLPHRLLAVDTAGQYRGPRIESAARGAPAVTSAAADASPAAAGERVCVITGGLGGVGRHLAAWALTAAPPAVRATRVVLVGRSVPADLAPLATHLADLCDGTLVASNTDSFRIAVPVLPASLSAPVATHEIAVSVHACDASDEAQLSTLLRDTSPHMVIHSAGVLADRAIAWMTAADMETSLRPKASAAWLLQRLLPPSAHLILCSSVSSALHTPGQANYAAGNAFLDSLALCSQPGAGGLRLSVGWGPWLGVGMAATFDPHAARSPCRPMRAQRALAALTLHVADALASRDVSRHILLADMPGPAHAAPAPSSAPTSSTEPPAALDLEKELLMALSTVLGRAQAELRVTTHDTPLHQHGLDSLAAMELRAILTRRSLPLPLRAVRAPTIGSLLAELRALPVSAALSAPPPAVATAEPQQRIPRAVAPSSPSRWLMPVVGDPHTAKHRVLLFNDAGGDPANFRCWGSTWPDQDIAVLAVHWPGHTARAEEGPCKSLREAGERFVAEALPFLQERPYAFVGQCVGAYYAYRFATAIASVAAARTPSALVAIACPGPEHMSVLTQFTDNPPGALPSDTAAERLNRGLHALTLAIGFTEEDWQRLQSDARLFAALVSDVSMTDIPAASPALPCPVYALLGANDPVVKRPHLLSWLERTTSFVHRSLPGLGHNIQYETPVIATINGWLAPVLRGENK